MERSPRRLGLSPAGIERRSRRPRHPLQRRQHLESGGTRHPVAPVITPLCWIHLPNDDWSCRLWICNKECLPWCRQASASFGRWMARGGAGSHLEAKAEDLVEPALPTAVPLPAGARICSRRCHRRLCHARCRGGSRRHAALVSVATECDANEVGDRLALVDQEGACGGTQMQGTEKAQAATRRFVEVEGVAARRRREQWCRLESGEMGAWVVTWDCQG